MAAQVDTLRLLAQPELTENRTARKSDTKEIKKTPFIQTGRRGGDGQPGQRGLVLLWQDETGGVWDERGRQSDHRQTLRPHIRRDKPRGPDSEWRRTGQAEWRMAPRDPTFAHR